MATEPNIAAIVLEADATAARVVIDGCADPAAVTCARLARHARERGVETGPEVLRELQAIAEAFAAAPGPVDQVFARATPPVHGEDAAIDWCPGFNPEQPVSDAPATRKDGRVDHYAKQCFIRVQPGDHIATIRPPTPGTPGRDVTGRVLAAKPGALLPFEIDPSLRVLPDGRVIAERAGRLVLDGCRLVVDPLLEVDGTVDFHTGHIDFEGDIHIGEDIRDRFRVCATGRIVVDGIVDACHLHSGGDIVAHQGIAGRGEGTINVGRDLIVGYLDQLTGRVGRNLIVSRSIRRCLLAIGGDLLGESGVLVGGDTTVAGNVRIAELGAPSETPTELRIAPVPRPGVRRLRRPEESTIEVLRMVHPMVTLTVGSHTVTFAEPVKGPVRFWISEGVGLLFRVGVGEAQQIRTLKGANASAA